MILKFDIKIFLTLFLPLMFWGILAWFGYERVIQVMAYPFSYFILLFIYPIDSKVNRIYLLLFLIISSLLIIVINFRSLSLNYLFFYKVLWLIFIPLQFSKKIIKFKFNSNALSNILKFTRYFIYTSWLLFFIQISLGPVAKIADNLLNIYKFTGGWFDANYYGAFCLLIYIGLDQISNKFLEIYRTPKHYNALTKSKKLTLNLLAINILLTFSVTSIFLLLTYFLFKFKEKLYRFLLSVVIVVALLSFTVVSTQAVDILKGGLIDNKTFDSNPGNFNAIQIFYQYRVYSLKMRLQKSQDVFNDKEQRDKIATHNSLITIFQNIKFDNIINRLTLLTGLIIFMSFVIILFKSIGFYLAVNFIILSMVLDPFFSGFSLSLPILITVKNLKNSFELIKPK